MKMLQEAIDQADNYAKKLELSLNKIGHFFPVSAETLVKIPDEEIGDFELLTTRFTLLQEFMGTKLFTLLLIEAIAESVKEMTFIDKINHLERLEIIDDAEEWKKIEKIRLRQAKLYPDSAASVAVELYTNSLTFTEKTTKMKRMQVVDNIDDWQKMRKLRNLITHSYPDIPGPMAELFNDVYNMSPKLLECLDRIHKILKRL